MLTILFAVVQTVAVQHDTVNATPVHNSEPVRFLGMYTGTDLEEGYIYSPAADMNRTYRYVCTLTCLSVEIVIF